MSAVLPPVCFGDCAMSLALSRPGWVLSALVDCPGSMFDTGMDGDMTLASQGHDMERPCRGAVRLGGGVDLGGYGAGGVGESEGMECGGQRYPAVRSL